MSRAPVRLAAAGLLASLLVAGWSAHRALTLEPLPAAKGGAPLPTVPQVVPRGEYPSEYLLAAVEADPFHPERRRPSRRFRLPGEEAVEPAAPGDPLPPPPPEPTAVMRLSGTMLLPDGRAYALLQWGGEPPRLVRTGERVGEHTLSRVESGHVILTSRGGGRTVLRVSDPGT